MNTDLMFSSVDTGWGTPMDLYNQLNQEFLFDLDPCASAENAKCERFFTTVQDGLTQDWAPSRVFMNPPYGRSIGRWIKKAYDSSQAGALVVCLIPARTDTSWWHTYCRKGEIRYIRGRVKFVLGDSTTPAPFPSAVVIFRPQYGPYVW